MEDLEAAKRAARKAALNQRHSLDAAVAGLALASHVLQAYAWPPGTKISGFWPLGQEIDLRPLLNLLHEQGNHVLLPVTPPRGQPLTFRRWTPGMMMVRERFGTLCPTGEEADPDVLLIPLLAFDRSGGRLGYGGGYYDRTLARLPNRPRIGCAYAVQEVDVVPVGPYDIRLDAVATEVGIIVCEGAK